MLIVEELHLLLTRPDGRPEPATMYRPYAEVAAVLVELAQHERIALTDERYPRLVVLSTEPTGSPVLDATLALLGPFDGKRLMSVVVSGKLDPVKSVVASLTGRGIATLGDRGFLGMGAPKMVEVDPQPEAQVRSRLGAVIHDRQPPTPADVTLLSLLQSIGVAHRILKEEAAPMRTRDLSAAIARIVDRPVLGDALTAAVASMNAALSSTVFVMVAGADGSGGGGDGGGGGGSA